MIFFYPDERGIHLLFFGKTTEGCQLLEMLLHKSLGFEQPGSISLLPTNHTGNKDIRQDKGRVKNQLTLESKI